MRDDDDQVAADLEYPEPLINRRSRIVCMLEAMTRKYCVLRVVRKGQGVAIVSRVIEINADRLRHDGHHIAFIAFVADVEDRRSGQVLLDKTVVELCQKGLANLRAHASQ